MTAAFNLAQLANRTNTSGQLDAAAGLSGLVANANLASSGTASSSTFLRGDRTWSSVGAGLPAATQAQAEAGTDNTVSITPLSLRQGLRASGSAPVFAARAWVNFNGTGTVAIRSSGNVSSITDIGSGAYGINFTTAMADTNYANFATTNNGGVMDIPGATNTTKTTSRVDLNTRTNTGALQDASQVSVCIYR